MSVSVSGLIECALRDAPGALVPDRDRAALAAVPCRGEPIAVGFECRLVRPGAPIDVSLRLAPGGPAVVDAIFHEFDRILGAGFRRDPLVFHRFGAGIAADAAIAAIAHLEQARDVVDQLAQRMQGLPDARVTDYGRLDARQPGWARIGVLVPTACVRELLAHPAWDSARRPIAALLASIAGSQPGTRVQLDLGARTGLAGIELHADQTTRGGAAWRPLLAALADHGLCTAGEIAAIAGWPQQTAVQIEGRRYTRGRTVSHVKLSRDADGATLAKVYLFAALTRFPI